MSDPKNLFLILCDVNFRRSIGATVAHAIDHAFSDDESGNWLSKPSGFTNLRVGYRYEGATQTTNIASEKMFP